MKYRRSITPWYLVVATIIGGVICFASSISSQPPHPFIDLRVAAHALGNIQLTVTNWGLFGYGNDQEEKHIDPLTGQVIENCEYPREKGHASWQSSVEIGAVVGYDTLLNGGFRPDVKPFGAFEYQSADPDVGYFSHDARSPLDLVCTYYDTTYIESPSGDWFQEPLMLEITQRSMSWLAEAVDDFVMIELSIRNVGNYELQDMWVSTHGGAFLWFERRTLPEYQGEIVGYLNDYHFVERCFRDTLRLAYAMSPTGEPVDGAFTSKSHTSAVGTFFLSGKSGHSATNFNWWANELGNNANNWAPRRAGTPDDPFRVTGDNYSWGGSREDDYYLVSHPEVDYDQLFSSVSHVSEGWLPRHPQHGLISRGSWLGQLALSQGPFNLGPGEVAEVVFAIVGGEHVHHDPTAFERLFDPLDPQPYYDQLDFSELAENALWAKWVYDNPGRDTDGDGYAGEFRVCNGDTIWVKGDGVPDFSASTPPPPPVLRVIPSMGKLTIRWNGSSSETTKDPFSNLIDFEGYRVFYALDELVTSLTLLSSYDRQNYNVYQYTEKIEGVWEWIPEDQPQTLDSLRIKFNDPALIPELWTLQNPYEAGGEFYYFQAVDFNQSELGLTRGISKAFPNATDPGVDSALWAEDDITREHGVPLPKFYEYEYTLDNLLSTIPYYVSVTAFDFGFKGGGLPSAESDPLATQTLSFAQIPSDTVVAHDLGVYVYPNPYRIDGGYAEQGYEWRIREQEHDRNRKLHFANLPPVCTISIYSLDGDLIRSFEHDYPPDDPAAMHDAWDFITRSGMAPVSGLYYWTVESPTRTQIGKFVFIK